MLPFILSAIGGYFIGNALSKKSFANGGGVDGESYSNWEFWRSEYQSEVDRLKRKIGLDEKENQESFITDRDRYRLETAEQKLANHLEKGEKLGYYANGGGVEEGVDLFEDYENIPDNVQRILDKYSYAFENGDYKGLTAAHNELTKIGYTFEFYLDGQAYDLRKIGQRGKSEDNIFEGGGMVDGADGFKWHEFGTGDSALVKGENKLGTIVKAYGRKFHLRFPDGSMKTYDAQDLMFLKDEDEYADGGGVEESFILSKYSSNAIYSIPYGDDEFFFVVDDILSDEPEFTGIDWEADKEYELSNEQIRLCQEWMRHPNEGWKIASKVADEIRKEYGSKYDDDY